MLNKIIRIFKDSETLSNPSILIPIIGGFLIPFLIGFLHPSIINHFLDLIFFIILGMPLIVIGLILSNWRLGNGNLRESFWKYLRPVPPGLVFGTDLKRDAFPSVTVTLICINCIVFIYQTEAIVDWGAFLPYGQPGVLHIMASIFTSGFLHGDFGHLACNMLFLWVFGATLESRAGHFRFGWIYMLCLVASSVIPFAVLTVYTDNYHSIGASGAISGIMGVFVVRCFFARVKFSFPIPFIPFFSMPLRLQGTFLIGVYFAMDLSGSVRMLTDGSIRINYWAHVGGYLAGFLIGFILKLHHEAAQESTRAKARRLSQKEYAHKKPAELYRKVLEEEPDNLEALTYLFNNATMVNGQKAASYFGRLADVLVEKDFKAALELVDSHYPHYVWGISETGLYRLGKHHLDQGNLIKARTLLEIAVNKQGSWQARSMMLLAQAFYYLDNPSRAVVVYQDVINLLPGTGFATAAEAEISKINLHLKTVKEHNSRLRSLHESVITH